MLDVTAYPVVDAHRQDAGPAASRPLRLADAVHGPRWCVIASYPQAERRAAASLALKGYQTYLPLVAVTRRDRVVRSMLHRVEIPLWPGYLFVRLDTRDPWYPIRYAPGVFQLLTNADRSPAPVADHILAALQATEDARRSLPPPGARWAPGAACSLSQGPLASMPAVILRCDHDTATIACLFLGQLREITVPVDCLSKRDD